LVFTLILFCIGIDKNKLRSIQCEGVEVSIEDICVFFDDLVLCSAFALTSQFDGAFVIFELGKAEQTMIKERWPEDCNQQFQRLMQMLVETQVFRVNHYHKDVYKRYLPQFFDYICQVLDVTTLCTSKAWCIYHY
jgi:hypothetical protein